MPIKTNKIGALEYLTAEGISAAHCFTTRFGGVSEEYLDSLNIGIHRGDSWENVLKNYEILGNALDFDLRKVVLSHQTHTDTVFRVGKGEWGAGLFAPELAECDALVTDEPGTALVIFTADCTPILLHDPVTGAVGAVHAGWRGTASGIAAKAVRAMADSYGCEPKNIRAAIGPNIGRCCFETDGDVPAALRAALGPDTEAFITQKGPKYYVDLKLVNALWLQRAGVTQIEISTHCTACRQDLFWSHRKVGLNRGSQGAIIYCKEVQL